ncbi:MAG: hypothetical protein HKN72_11810 [Gemmatimonadetes bacterium]|nr:hypothetical protein [Gemmatimonadota bacterium]
MADAYADGRLDEYDRRIRQLLEQQYVIKNCFEIRTLDFNLDIAARSSEGGAYKHLILLRGDEAKRLLSLAVAMETGSWSPREAEAVIQELEGKPNPSIKLNIRRYQIEHQRCQARLLKLKEFFDSRAIPFEVVHFEEIYVGDEAARIARLEEVLRFLELGPASDDDIQRLFTKAQKSGDIYAHVSNLDQFLADVIEPPSAAAKLMNRVENAVHRVWMGSAPAAGLPE